MYALKTGFQKYFDINILVTRAVFQKQIDGEMLIRDQPKTLLLIVCKLKINSKVKVP